MDKAAVDFDMSLTDIIVGFLLDTILGIELQFHKFMLVLGIWSLSSFIIL